MVNPKKVVRKMLSGKLLRSIESEYRLARASYANARFLWPAKGMRVIMITGTNGKTTTAIIKLEKITFFVTIIILTAGQLLF
jgi:folylpolyglutamate synthase/dihydropteroate synthase